MNWYQVLKREADIRSTKLALLKARSAWILATVLPATIEHAHLVAICLDALRMGCLMVRLAEDIHDDKTELLLLHKA